MRIVCVCVCVKSSSELSVMRRRGDLGRFRAALSVMMLGDEWKQELADSWNNNGGGRGQR